MRKIWKQAVSALLAGMMVLQSAPALAAGAIYGIGSLPKLIDTQSRIVSGAARASVNDEDEWTATLSDAVGGLAFTENEYKVASAGQIVTLTGTITLASVSEAMPASLSDAIWASASDAEYPALFEAEDDNEMLTDISVKAFKDKTFQVTAKAGDSLTEEGTYVTISLIASSSICAKTHVALDNEFTDDVNTLKVTPSSKNMIIGDTCQLTVETTLESEPLVYESLDADIATVSDAGEVKALSVGDTRIKVFFEDEGIKVEPVYCDVHVTSAGIRITQKNMNLKVGERSTLEATASPADAALVYESTNPAVATVSNAGEVTALSAGDARIKVSLDGFDVEPAYCDVHVTSVPVTPPTEYAIRFGYAGNTYLTVGHSATRKAIVTPEDAEVIYTSSDESVATVDAEGKVNALKVGETVITAKISGTDKQAAYTVYVYEAMPAELMIDPEILILGLDDTDESLFMTRGIIEAWLAGDAKASKFTWTVEDPTIVGLHQLKIADPYWSTAEVTVKAAGTTKITVKAGELQKTCIVIVMPAEEKNDLNAKLAEIIAGLEELNYLYEEEQTAVVKDIVTAVADLEISEDDMIDEDVVAKLEYIEAALVACGYYEAPTVDVADNVGINVETPVGMILSLDPEKHQGCKPVLSLKKSEENVTLPSGITNTFALDIQILAKNDEKDTSESITTLNVPVVIKAETPEALISALKLGRMLVYHYHGTTTSPKTLTPELLDDGAAFSITVKEFSTFVLAAKVYNSSSSSSSSGGGGGSSSVGKTSTPNLSGTWVQDATGWWFKLTNGGYPAGNWGRINNKWYYFNAQGYMMTGWVQVSGKWYYLQPAGDMVESNWVFDQNCWYYLEKDGAMSAGKWFQYKNNWYYLGAKGAMAVNTATPDGYQVNAEGIWIQ